jgi:beta-glucosidase
MVFRSLVTFSLLVCCSCPALTGERFPRVAAHERAIDSILSVLTLEEKVGQLVQYSGRWHDSSVTTVIKPEYLTLVREGKLGSLLNVFGSRLTRELQDAALRSRARIPLLFGLDVIHGFRTTFPIPLAEASTWEPAKAELSARIAATEAAASGIHWTFAPMVDVARDPRWGRIAEGAGEDPYLGSVMAAARVRGFQGASLAADSTILACVKHFAAYGGAEGGRDYNTVDISDRTLRDVYLPPFRAAVEAGAGSLMASFNEIGGVPSSASRYLLTDILRGEWGFDGFVVSDWNSVGELLPHGVAADRREAARLGITAGIDMDMAGDIYREQLADAVRAGSVSMATLNEAVRRVLRLKFRLGLFDDPYRYCSPEREEALLFHPRHRAAALDVARRSMVLLRNHGSLLPLSRTLEKLAVIGPLADDRKNPLGPWDGPSLEEHTVTVLEGVRKAVGPSTSVRYARGCGIADTSRSGIPEAVALARTSDVVLLVVGESSTMSGEAASRTVLDLPGVQPELVRAVHATGVPVVLVLLNGRPLTIPWIAENIPAILEAWFPGSTTGDAVAGVLFGDYNPSGKLPVTFPRSVGQVPIYYNHKHTGRPPDPQDPYTSKYIDERWTPLYPFGFGLSYTTFTYSDLRLRSKVLGENDTLHVTVTLRNTGTRSGEEVVQLYVRDHVGSVTRPVKELKAFRKISLDAGAGSDVVLAVSVRELAFTREGAEKVVEPGTFSVYVGGNSAETLEQTFEVR